MLSPADVRIETGIEREWSKVPKNFSEAVKLLLFKRAKWPLLIYGNVGNGKTCAALALCDHISRNAGAAYFTLDQLCRLTIGSDQDAKSQAWEAIETKALLVLDEIGARKSSELVYSVLLDVLDRRERLRKCVAIYISNLHPRSSPEHPENGIKEVFDDRIYSRMTRGVKCHFKGDDQRGLF